MSEQSMVERVARALEQAEFGYESRLNRLVDGVSTYRLTYDDGSSFEFEDISDVHEHVADRKRQKTARAAIAAMREPTIDMEVAGTEQWLCESAMEDRSKANWHAMIDAALADAPDREG